MKQSCPVLEALNREDELISNTTHLYDARASKMAAVKSAFSLPVLLSCPLGTFYFMRFLQTELNQENLQCLFQIRVLSDYVRTAYITTDNEHIVASVFQKYRDVHETYVKANSIGEINIDNKTRRVLEDTYNELIKMANSQAVNVQIFLSTLERSLEVLDRSLVANISDPYVRFMRDSNELVELLTVLTTSDDYIKKRTEFVESNMNGIVLNDFTDLGINSRHPLTVASELLQALYDNFINNSEIYTHNKQGTIIVNSACLEQMRFWTWMQERMSELKGVDLSILVTDEEKMCFFVNCFHLLLLHAALLSDGKIPKCNVSRAIFYRKFKYKIGGHAFSLDEIRYGILGMNQVHWLFGARFGKNDTRLAYVINNRSQLLQNVQCVLTDLNEHSSNLFIFDKVELFSMQVQQIARHCIVSVMTKKDSETIMLPTILYDNAHHLKLTGNYPKNTSNENVVSNYAFQVLTGLEPDPTVNEVSLPDLPELSSEDLLQWACGKMKFVPVTTSNFNASVIHALHRVDLQTVTEKLNGTEASANDIMDLEFVVLPFREELVNEFLADEEPVEKKIKAKRCSVMYE